jgi:hypothetical protein
LVVAPHVPLSVRPLRSPLLEEPHDPSTPDALPLTTTNHRSPGGTAVHDAGAEIPHIAPLIA